MPPRTAIPRSTTDDSDGETVQLEISELLEKMRRSAIEKRRKKREEIAANYTKELAQMEMEVAAALTEGQREANKKHVDVLTRLLDAIRRRSEVEEKLMGEFKEVHEKLVETVTVVFGGGGAVQAVEMAMTKDVGVEGEEDKEEEGEEEEEEEDEEDEEDEGDA